MVAPVPNTAIPSANALVFDVPSVTNAGKDFAPCAALAPAGPKL
jgi:hypothetical protein